MKIAVIFHRFGPYHMARLEAATRCGQIVAIELASETAEYDWQKVRDGHGFTRVTLFPEGDSRAADPRELQHRVTTALTAARPEVVAVPGWSDPGALAALRWCSQTGTPAILMSESTAHDETRVGWKELVKRRIVNLYSTALVGGRLHSEYLQQLGMPAERIFTGYDVVDNAHFAQEKTEKLKTENLKLDFGVSVSPSVPFFLASARFIEKKNLPTLIRAYAQYRESTVSPVVPWSLVLLGNGPLQADLCSMISDLALNDFVVMPGFKQYEELPAWYGRASAFIHASTSEQWGLVVNEAMAAGLPVIVSNRCGCVPELVQESVNGFTFDPSNASELANLMVKISQAPEDLRREMGRASQKIIQDWTPARFAQGLKEAAESATRVGPVKANWCDALLLRAMIRR